MAEFLNQEIVAKIDSVRSYNKAVQVNGVTKTEEHRVATLKFANYDRVTKKSGIMQRFVAEGEADFDLYVPVNRGKNIVLACPNVNRAANGAWFITVEDAWLDSEREWCAPVDMTVNADGDETDS